MGADIGLAQGGRGGRDEKSSDSGDNVLMDWIWGMIEEKDSRMTSKFHLTSFCQFSIFFIFLPKLIIVVISVLSDIM